MCKWNVFTIDSPQGGCDHDPSRVGKIFTTWQNSGVSPRMTGRVVAPVTAEMRFPTAVPVSTVRGIIGAIDKPVLVADRDGRILAVNEAAKHLFGFPVDSEVEKLNLFEDLLKWEAAEVMDELSSGKGLIDREMDHASGRKLVRLQAAAESDWFVAQVKDKGADGDAATQLTVQ